MNIRVLSVFLCAAGLYGQYDKHHRFSWQEACFKNPGAPFCAGNDFAVKRTPGKDGTHKGGGRNGSGDWVPESLTPQVIVVGGIDWRFADPQADGLAGFNFSKGAASPLARALMTQLGAKQGLGEAEMQKILESLSSGDQVAVSIRGDQMLIMVTGCTADSTFAALEPGWKAAPMLGNMLLLGPEDAVDEAVERVGMQGPLTEMATLAEQRQAANEFWVAGSAKLAGGEAASMGVKQFVMTASMRDRLTSDTLFEFNGAPDANKLQMWPALAGAAIDGKAAYAKVSMEADDVQQKFDQVAGSLLGQRLGAMVKAARYVPVRETATAVHTKPVIYGLDSGPREQKQ